MKRLSIYETSWINLVFENKNKNYGAYQLRQESSRTTVISFFMGLLLIVALTGIYKISSLLVKPTIDITPTILDEQIIITPYDVVPIEKQKTTTKQTQTKVPKEHNALLPMVVSSTPDVLVEIPTNATIENHSINSGTGGETGTVITTGGIESPALPMDYGNTIVNTTALDKLPEFPGGMDKFYKYVGNNFEKPEIDGVSTMKVLVFFVIEKDGRMTDIQVRKDPGYGLGKEAIRVLKSLKTKWLPGMIGSKPVRTSYTLPITVQIN